MAEVVFVHGIGQGQLGPAVLGQEWRPALSDGVLKAEAPQLAERLLLAHGVAGAVDARMAFYGDLFAPADVQGGGADLDDLDEDEAALVQELAVALLHRGATHAARSQDRRTAQDELDRLQGTLGEEQGARNAARSALAGLARLRWFAPMGMAVAQRFVVRSLTQVTRYLSEPELREKVQARVAEHLKEDTRVLIGHSLGSVVAYEAACRRTTPLPLLVTLGSPLGLRTLIYDRLEKQPPPFPPHVGWWVNVAAEDDIVAAVPDLTSLFAASVPAAARWDGGVSVDNGSKPHDATHYLTKPQVGRPVATTLTLNAQ